MNFLLFAAGSVGYEIAQFFGEHKEPISGLVLDAKDRLGINPKIIQVLEIDAGKIIFSNDLYEAATIAQIKELQIDLGILAWWPYIIREPIIQIPQLGLLNFHPSYLPYNRGKHYNFWTIVEGTPFGVTIHFIDKGVDTGQIAFQSQIKKSWTDTGKTLYAKAQKELIRLFTENFDKIKHGDIPKISQDMNQGSFHQSNELDAASFIDLNKAYTARDLLNILRARTFPPHPAAWFVDDGDEYEVRIEITKRKHDERI